MSENKSHRRSYRTPTITVHSTCDLWRELGPAQALTAVAPGRPEGGELPSNPLRIPPAGKP